jgi:hypothetical protein
MTKRLNFGPYRKNIPGGMSFEEYVLNALNRIEKWSYDVTTRFDAEAGVTNALLLETGDHLLTQAGSTIGLES